MNRPQRKTRGQHLSVLAAVTLSCGLAITPAAADVFFFSTGDPDGKIAMGSDLLGSGTREGWPQTADDFVTTQPTLINSATFIGLLPLGVPLSDVVGVGVDLYHVFPTDSTNPPDGRVDTRVNSPSDVPFDSRDSSSGQLTFTTTLLDPRFTALNSVINGINAKPNQFTGGEGPVTGEEVQINVTFTTPFSLGPDHVFFSPSAGVLGSSTCVLGCDFLWLSAPKPIVAPGTPFADDLETWIRSKGFLDDLAPDWSRVGTDVTHEGPFNAAFSLTGTTTGTTTPEPNSMFLIALALLGLGAIRHRRNSRKTAVRL